MPRFVTHKSCSWLNTHTHLVQVVWTGGDKSTSLWCAYSGAFLGTIDRGKELGLPESSSFSRESAPRSVADEWRAKVDTNKVQHAVSEASCQ